MSSVAPAGPIDVLICEHVGVAPAGLIDTPHPISPVAYLRGWGRLLARLNAEPRRQARSSIWMIAGTDDAASLDDACCCLLVSRV
jgi:hypothetical protein